MVDSRKEVVCALLVVLALTGTAHAQEPATATLVPSAAWIIDDFEDGDISDWGDAGGPCSASATTATAAWGSYSITISGACGHYLGRYLDIGQIAADSFSLWARPGSTSLFDTYIVLGDENATGDHGVVFFYAHADGTWTISAGGAGQYSCGTYNANQWYYVVFYIDWIYRTVDVYIDGTPRQTNIPFRSATATYISRIHLYNVEASNAWWDMLEITTPPPPIPIFDDGFETGDTTAWSLTIYK